MIFAALLYRNIIVPYTIEVLVIHNERGERINNIFYSIIIIFFSASLDLRGDTAVYVMLICWLYIVDVHCRALLFSPHTNAYNIKVTSKTIFFSFPRSTVGI